MGRADADRPVVRYIWTRLPVPMGILNPELYSGHSPRSGCAADMSADGHDWRNAAMEIGWASATAQRLYIGCGERHHRVRGMAGHWVGGGAGLPDHPLVDGGRTRGG